jgi:hypothetical protein
LRLFIAFPAGERGREEDFLRGIRGKLWYIGLCSTVQSGKCKDFENLIPECSFRFILKRSFHIRN